MVEISHELKFPLMAGSSIPVAYRPEGVDLDFGAKVRHAVSIFYADPDAYGFHNLEGLQCMIQQLGKGETGVEAVQYVEKQAMSDGCPKPHGPKSSSMRHWRKASRESRVTSATLEKTPCAFRVWHRDGLETASFMTNGIAQDAATAVEVEGQTPSRSPPSCGRLQEGQPSSISHAWSRPSKKCSKAASLRIRSNVLS